MDTEKKFIELKARVQYARDILAGKKHERLEAFATRLQSIDFENTELLESTAAEVEVLWQRFQIVEKEIDAGLTAMDRVRIVRHPDRICLKDILENVYDNYTEIGGHDEHSIDPGMLIARAYFSRRIGNKIHIQPVMVVGQEKGHGQEFRNGGSIKPWGNYKALKYMKVAARENIPIHTYVFTPGSYPIEDFPGAAQQIAENIYEMCGLEVPIVSVISEGGSGGAEAVAMADHRIMLSHGYYSVISPEGAAAIEGRLKGGQRAPATLIEQCAQSQRITAADNLRLGYVDTVLEEPPLGARPEHFNFFRQLRVAVIRATDDISLSVRSIRFLRKMALRWRKGDPEKADIFVRWDLSFAAKQRLLNKRTKKYLTLARHAFSDERGFFEKIFGAQNEFLQSLVAYFRYRVFKQMGQGIGSVAAEASAELHVVTEHFNALKQWFCRRLGLDDINQAVDVTGLTTLSQPINPQDNNGENGYICHKAFEDREVTCPNAHKRGCLDIWARDLYDDFAGVCPTCGYHFPIEYQWYLANVFDSGSIEEFNANIASSNPTEFPNFLARLDAAKQKTGLKSACITFDAQLKGIKLTCGMLVADFRGGSVGAAEGEKFIRALEVARKKHQPFLAYVHGTAGIRIQEGVNGLIQMPRVTMAVRRYIEAGGLYIVLYDTNSYAGPVASFLGCSPYQYAVHSSRIGFAGPAVIKETTGMDIPPNYHECFKALTRGHIQDVWSRRDIRENLHQAFLTIGGRNLYYR